MAVAARSVRTPKLFLEAERTWPRGAARYGAGGGGLGGGAGGALWSFALRPTCSDLQTESGDRVEE